MVAPHSSINRWIVVGAAFSAQFILEGIILALDVLPPYILRYFRSTNAEVTLFGAVVHGFSHILGPVSSIVASKFGDRKLVLCCSITATVAFLAASLSQEVWHLVLACAFVGVSFGLAWVPPVTVVSFHFKKKRHIVTSATTIGGALGYDAFEIMPLRLADEGMTGNKIPLAVSLHAVFDIFGRLSAAVVVGRFDQCLTYNGFLVAGGICRIMLSWPSTFAVYAVYIAASGFCFGVVKAAAPSVLLELVGLERINFAFGMWLLTSGLGGMTGPPLSGFMVDYFGNYFVAFMLGGMLILIASLPLAIYHWPLNKLFSKCK
uniref:Major facilitator superfamily (MFS) profile domain-containing protein n=1 Tax=Romanomermis culicivorax TaxID=13658 RepID=A0A915JCI2_ROMCU